MIVKGFFHGRGRHSKGWDGYILCGIVKSEDDVFDKTTCEQYTDLRNYPVLLKQEPTQEELTAKIVECIAKHIDSIENPPPIEDSPEIAKLKELGVLKAEFKNKTIMQIEDSDIKFKDKTLPMQKLEAVGAIIDGSTETNVDDYVENQFTDEEQLDLALKVKEIKDNKVGN
jgi:hypothetical protein